MGGAGPALPRIAVDGFQGHLSHPSDRRTRVGGHLFSTQAVKWQIRGGARFSMLTFPSGLNCVLVYRVSSAVMSQRDAGPTILSVADGKGVSSLTRWR